MSLVGPFTRIVRFPEKTLERSRLEDPEKFTERFGALLQKVKRPRLVIAIDNLDRCSPDRVEELLSTIKTYLEPAAQQSEPRLLRRLAKSSTTKDAVFVIAADDEALRRHLEAKESAASGRQRSSAEISRYVDEYLRKFFPAIVRIRPLLDADMKAYAERELADFNEAHSLSDETRAALVEMVAAALSRNPRRVKQFANNLEARLRVVTQREAEGRIHPPISDQILVIAKVAILEEEWPRSFAVLQENPRALDAWQTQVVEGQGPSAPDNEDVAFLRFISRSRAIRATNLSAFLRLKQSQEEIELPRYADFLGALELGTPDEVEKILAEDAERVSAYARLLPNVLEDELARRNIEGARAIVEMATSVPALAAEREVLRGLLARAVGDGDLRAGLRGIRLRPLMEASRLLTEADRQRLLAEFLDLQAFLGQSPERLSQVLEAFAAIAESIPNATRTTLSQRLAADEFAPHLEAVLPLAEANPDCVPRETAVAALTKLSAAFDIESPEFRLLRAWLKRSSVPPDLKANVVAVITNVVLAQGAN